MKYRYLLFVFLLSLITACGDKQDLHNQQPNIVFIMADDFTSQAWGIYGGILKDYIKNDHIKELASRGTVLTNAFCTNSLCAPSRATILTGQYSQMNGVYGIKDSLQPEHPNIAKTLQQAGYQTAVFGKWHLRKKPSGFDDYQLLHGLGVYHDPVFYDSTNWRKDGKQIKGFVDDIITRMSIDWMKNRNKEKPFLLMCHFKSTHEPFGFADRFKGLYKGITFPYPSTFNDSGATTTGRTFPGQTLKELQNRYIKASTGPFWTSYPELPFSVKGLSPEEAHQKTYQKFIRDYLRCVAGINDNLGKLMHYLDAHNLSENTVIILTSDQGYFLGEHNFMDKRLMYEESLRMPFIIVYPREIKAGTQVDDMILNTDFAALLADYAGIKIPDYIQGRSFRANLQGHTPSDWRTSMYYRYWVHLPLRPAHYGIRNERYKLIYYYGQPLHIKGAYSKPSQPAWEFYDLKADPKEIHNAIHDQKYQDIIQRMKKELLKLKKEAKDSIGPRPKTIYPPQEFT